METWKPIPGHEAYDVSDLGRVRRRLGGRGTYPLRILKPSPDQDGYQLVSLSTANVQRKVRVHALVLAAFVGPRPADHDCSHLDGVRDHNALSNLVYEPHHHNMARQDGAGTSPRGERHGCAKINDTVVREIRGRCAAGEQRAAVATSLNISVGIVSAVIRGDRWAHVGEAA